VSRTVTSNPSFPAEPAESLEEELDQDYETLDETAEEWPEEPAEEPLSDDDRAALDRLATEITRYIPSQPVDRSFLEHRLTDPRFSDPAKQVANAGQLTAIFDGVFASQPMAHWREVFDHAHITFGEVKSPSEVINDPQLRENDIVVPLEGAGGKLTATISSHMQVHGVAKVPARRAPDLGEHTEEILKQLGFSATEIDGLRASGATPNAKERAA
jgi:crotonobetainyl-CoA:carnitine CoA-transferase CaiB-like acyl-CoA transferase